MSTPSQTPPAIGLTSSITILVMGVISGFASPLAPLLLAQMHRQGLISLAQIGQGAMIEALGMAIAASLAALFLKPVRLKAIVAAVALAAVAVNLLTPHLSPGMFLVARLVAGLAAGVLLWLWVGLLIRVATPARWIAIYATLLASSAFGLAALFSTLVLPRGGAAAGYACLALAYVLILSMSWLIPSSLSPCVAAEERGLPRGRALIGLVAIFLYVAAILATWVYIVPFGAQIGRSNILVSSAVSIGLGSQILAGLSAAVLATRLHALAAILLSGLASILGIAIILSAPGDAMFIVGVVLVGFFWMFAPAFLMPYIIAIDPSGRAPMHLMTVQLFSLAAGPALASSMVSPTDVSGALFLGAGLFVVAMMLMAATWIRKGGSFQVEQAIAG